MLRRQPAALHWFITLVDIGTDNLDTEKVEDIDRCDAGDRGAANVVVSLLLDDDGETTALDSEAERALISRKYIPRACL